MSESRSIALIPGSFPEKTAELAMHAQMAIGGERIDYVSDGETGDRKNWVVAQIEGYRTNPAFKLVKDGDWSSYENCPEFAVADGHVLTPEDFQLQYAADAAQAWPTFAEMRAEQGLDHLKLTADVPSAKDLAYFVFGAERGGDAALQKVAMAATQQEIRKMRTAHNAADVFIGDQIVPSISTPLSGSMGLHPQEYVPEDLRVPKLAESLAELVSEAPQDSEFGIHLCVGDLNNMSRGHLADRKPSVDLMNEIAQQWPDNQHWRFVTDPIAAGSSGPSKRAEDYQALGRLQLPQGTRYIAGMVHESLSPVAAHFYQGLISGSLRLEQSVGWGPNCGLGRDSLRVANYILRLSALLATSSAQR